MDDTIEIERSGVSRYDGDVRKFMVGWGGAAISVAVLVACTGDDPILPSNTIVVNPDAGPGGSSGSSSGASSGGDSSGSSSSGGSKSDAADDRECAKITVTTLAGEPTSGDVDGAGDVARFNDPEGIAYRSDRNDFIVGDRLNKKVRTIAANGTVGTRVTGYAAGRIGYSASNGVYIADHSASQIFRVAPAANTGTSTVFSSVIAVGVALNGRVFMASTSSCAIHTIKSDGVEEVFTGKDDACGAQDGLRNLAQFSKGIVDFAFDTGRMFVADNANKAIRIVELATPGTIRDGFVTTLVGGLNGDAGVDPGETLEEIGGIAYDVDRDVLYVTDQSRIRQVDVKTKKVKTLLGSPGESNGDGCSAGFQTLKGIAYVNNALYAVDVNRVRKIQLPSIQGP